KPLVTFWRGRIESFGKRAIVHPTTPQMKVGGGGGGGSVSNALYEAGGSALGSLVADTRRRLTRGDRKDSPGLVAGVAVATNVESIDNFHRHGIELVVHVLDEPASQDGSPVTKEQREKALEASTLAALEEAHRWRVPSIVFQVPDEKDDWKWAESVPV